VMDHQLKPNRPHWWAVLSVGIALMALVTAISGAKRRGPEHLGAGGTNPRNTLHSISLAPTPHASRSQPNSPLPTTPILTAPSVAELASPANPKPGKPSDSPLVAPATTSTPSPPLPSSFDGYFESPWVVSTIYPVSSNGSLNVTATWSQSVALTLALSCSLSSQSKTGGPGISLSESGFDTQCVISLSEPFGTPGLVDYTVDVST